MKIPASRIHSMAITDVRDKSLTIHEGKNFFIVRSSSLCFRFISLIPFLSPAIYSPHLRRWCMDRGWVRSKEKRNFNSSNDHIFEFGETKSQTGRGFPPERGAQSRNEYIKRGVRAGKLFPAKRAYLRAEP